MSRETTTETGVSLDIQMEGTSSAEAKALARRTKQALADVLQPVRWFRRVGFLLSVVSGLCAVLPYVAIADLGHTLLRAYQSNAAPNPDDIMRGVFIVLAGLIGRASLYFTALAITHVGDAMLGGVLRQRIVDVLARAPLAYFTSTNSGAIAKVVQQDTKNLHYMVAHNDVETAAAATVPVGGLVYLAILDWRLALLALVPPAIYGIAYGTMSRGMGPKMVEFDRRQVAISARMVEFVRGIQVVKTFGRTGRAHQAYLRAVDEMAVAYSNWAKPMVKADAITQAFTKPPIIAIIVMGGSLPLVIGGSLSPINALVATMVALTIPTYVQVVGMMWWSRQTAQSAALSIHEFLSTPPLPVAERTATPQTAEVALDGVRFAYGDTLALDGVSLTCRPGTVTALVGSSGSGKTTLATLIARFQDPDEGTVTIGGVDVRFIDPAVLHRHVGFVLQDVSLVKASVRDNIRLGVPAADEAAVVRAASIAQVHDEICALPNGYDTILGDETSLSGGQAQRISIARAVLADTPVLILDEATAFADPESESLIQQALSTLVEGRTVIVIAHRLETIQGADEIVVLDAGRIVEQGTHAELLNRGGTYFSMWQANHAVEGSVR